MGEREFFRESQRFSPWVVRLVVAGALICSIVFVVLMIYQIGLDTRLGRRRVDDWILGTVGVLTIVTSVGVAWLFLVAELRTVINEKGLFVQFAPFQREFRRVPLERAKYWDAVTYLGMRDYGGWGLRKGRMGQAMTVHGERGVRIVFEDGRHLLIGSQRAEELQDALDRLEKRAPRRPEPAAT